LFTLGSQKYSPQINNGFLRSEAKAQFYSGTLLDSAVCRKPGISLVFNGRTEHEGKALLRAGRLVCIWLVRRIIEDETQHIQSLYLLRPPNSISPRVMIDLDRRGSHPPDDARHG
jgi:hypothetical protein